MRINQALKSKANWWLPVLILYCMPARADIISYSGGGTFSASTASSAFSGPGETWGFSFQADSNPTVLEFGNGGFNFAFSNFSYFLSDSPVAIMPTFIRFFSPGNGGGFEICFNGTTVANCTDGFGNVSFSSPMYSGTTSAPTLLPGTFAMDLGVAVNSIGYDLGSTTVQATAVPEPSSLPMFATVLVALCGRRLYRLS
jgi:hypothetical protein